VTFPSWVDIECRHAQILALERIPDEMRLREARGTRVVPGGNRISAVFDLCTVYYQFSRSPERACNADSAGTKEPDRDRTSKVADTFIYDWM